MHESDVPLAGDCRFELKNSFRKISGSICAPRGFKCGAVFCDIKKLGTGKGSEKGHKDDLALIVSEVPAAIAATFTSNQVCAAPVRISRDRAKRKFARAIVVNSRNANACTGAQGLRDAHAMTRFTATALTKLDRKDRSSFQNVSARDVLVCSTGRIGVAL